MTKCACSVEGCGKKITFDSVGKWMTIYKSNGEDISLFKLDANATVQLITELRDYLISMTNEEVV